MTILGVFWGYHHFRKHPDGSIFGISKLYAHRFSEVAPSHLRSTSSPARQGGCCCSFLSVEYGSMSEVQNCMKKGNPDPNSKMYENHERSMLQEASSHPYILKSWSFLPAVPVDAAERSSLWERPEKERHKIVDFEVLKNLLPFLDAFFH